MMTDIKPTTGLRILGTCILLTQSVWSLNLVDHDQLKESILYHKIPLIRPVGFNQLCKRFGGREGGGLCPGAGGVEPGF